MTHNPTQLSIIIPTYNESANVAELVTRINACLPDDNWEIIFVDDDSPDGTANTIRSIARTDRRIRCIRRIGRRGLSSACIEGMFASTGDFLAVMDADLQHDERILPDMLKCLVAGNADIMVGTRYSKGGSTGNWSPLRKKISLFATRASKLLIGDGISDPMSGFFMLRREVIESCAHQLSGLGFKILLDILASVKNKRYTIQEVPYRFRNRHQGESKLDQRVIWEFGMLVSDKLVGRYIPTHFVAFSLIGSIGLFVHLGILFITYKLIHIDFTTAQTIASVIAMCSNYILNNELTYRDRRLRGWKWVKGLISFIMCCSIGVIANVGIATHVFLTNSQWLMAALSGIVVGAVWNYAATRFFTWK